MSTPLPELRETAKKKWQSSGLRDAHAKRLHLEVLTAEQVASLGPPFAAAGALRIPYFTAEGKRTSFFRLRYLEGLPGFAGQIAKPQRYVQPARTLNEVYAPPLLDTPWASIMASAETPIYITEGELKAAAGCAAGLAVLGLGGVDVWRAGRRGLELLPMLRDTRWDQRPTTIVYDSDAATNPNVVRAQAALARALAERGAEVRVAALPAADDGAKQGLDDYLVRHGVDELRALLDEAEGWSEATALWEMNEEIVYIRDPGIIVVRGTGQKMAPHAFTAHAYANRHHLETTEENAKRRPTAKRWIEWPQRFEVGQIVYQPGAPQVTDSAWNTWRGWGVEPKKGDIKPWQDLLDYAFRSDPEARGWFERWCAYPLQHPGTKMFTSVVVWGVHHGTGKTLIGYTVRDIYGRNGDEVSDEDLRGTFNEWALDKQFIVGEEVTGDKPRVETDKFKRLITRQTVRINQKNIPTYVLRDCINYYFTSNHPDAFFLDDTDRRFFVHEVVGRPLPEEFYKRYDAWRKGEGPAHLFHHLLSLPLGDFNPLGHAPSTSSKRSMIMDNKSDLGSWCAALREDPTSLLRAAHMNGASECALFTTAQLLSVYDPAGRSQVTPNGMGRELKRAGFRQVNNGLTIRTALGCVRFYAIRELDRWARASPADCVAHWHKFFGPREAKFK